MASNSTKRLITSLHRPACLTPSCSASLLSPASCSANFTPTSNLSDPHRAAYSTSSTSLQQLRTSSILRTLSTATQRRAYHKRQALHFDVTSGCEPFLTPSSLELLAVDYQDGLLSRLNDLVRGTQYERMALVKTVVELAADRNHALAWNMASDALDNAYFLSRLTNNASKRAPAQADRLMQAIQQTYGSLQAFQHVFSSQALGLSRSGGYLWLVLDQNSELAIVATYGSGTVLVQNRQQRGVEEAFASDQLSDEEDLEPTMTDLKADEVDDALSTTLDYSNPQRKSAAAADVNPLTSSSSRPTPESSIRSAGGVKIATRGLSQAGGVADGVHEGRTVSKQLLDRNRPAAWKQVFTPLMCLSVHERAYMPDYGVWGLEEYLKNYWKVLDWSRLEVAYTSYTSSR